MQYNIHDDDGESLLFGAWGEVLERNDDDNDNLNIIVVADVQDNGTRQKRRSSGLWR